MQAIQARSYAAVPREADEHGSSESVPRRRAPVHNYIPKPLRLPFLLSYILLITGCIILIEIVLRHAESPSDAGLVTSPPVVSSTSVVKRTIYNPSKVKRSTYVYYVPSSVHCSEATDLSARLTSLSQVSRSLCSEFTATYSAYTRSFPSSIQSAASQWVLDINNVYEGVDDVELTAAYCVPKPSTTLMTNASQTAVQEEEGDPTITFGCMTKTVSCGCCCAECAGASLSLNGSSLETAISMWCAATASAMIAETSQPRTSEAPVTITESAMITSSAVIAQTSNAPTASEAKSTASSIQTTASLASMVASSVISSKVIVQTSSTKSTSDPEPPSTTSVMTTSLITESTSEETLSVPSSTLLVITTSERTTSTMRTTLESIIATSVLEPTSQAESPTDRLSTVAIISTNVVIATSNSAISTETISTSSSIRPDVLTESLLYTVSDTTVSAGSPSSTTANGIFSIVDPLSSSAETSEVTPLERPATSTAEALTNAVPPSSLAVITTTTQFTSWIETIGADGSSTNVTAVVVRPTTYTTDITALATQNTQQSISSTTSRSPQPTLALTAHEIIVMGTFNSGYYFAALYLPALMAVLIKALWEALYVAIMLIEPFERMNHQEGAPAKYSLFAEYLSGSLSLDIFRSLGRGNILPFIATLSFVLVQIATPLVTISMTVIAGDMCLIDGQERRCDPRWVVNAAFLRSVEGVLGACILSIFVIAILVQRHQSGVSSDPSSLASVANLLNHEQLIRDIQNTDVNATQKSFERAFEQHICWIGYHKTSDGVAKYGIVGSQGLEHNDSDLRTFLDRGRNYQAVENPAQVPTTLSSSSTTIWALFVDVLGLLVPLTLFAIIVAFWFDSRDDVLNKFFNTATIWPKLVLVSLATISALLMSYIERTVRIVEPFRRLAASPRTPPETTVLVKRSGTAYSSLLRCLPLIARHEFRGGRMSFQALVAFATILADLNIIAVAGIAFTEAMVWKQYKISSFVSMALLGYIILIWLVVLLWWRNNATVKAVRISKVAETVGGVMRYFVHGGTSWSEKPTMLDRGTERASLVYAPMRHNPAADSHVSSLGEVVQCSCGQLSSEDHQRTQGYA